MSRPRGRTAGVVLFLCCLAQFMVVLDVTIVNVALPDIGGALGMTAAGQQWVVNAYTLTFAGFLMFGARLADFLGHRRVFLVGVAGFAVFSVLGGLAGSGAWLIAMRAAQGLAGAILAPSTLSVLTGTFTEPAARRRALGAWTGTAATGAAAGMILGGALTQLLDWRWVLFVKGPIGLVLFLGAFRYLGRGGATPASRGRLDVLGAALVTGGLSLLVYGIVSASARGWADPVTLGGLSLGVAVLAGFALVEWRRGEAALVPLRVFRMRVPMLANAVAAVVGVALFGMYFFVAAFLRIVNGYPPLIAGMAFVPAALATAAGTLVGARTVRWLGAGRQIVLGLATACAGMLWLSRNSGPVGYTLHLLPPLVLLGLGLGAAFVPSTLAATGGLPPAEAGLASGLVSTSRQVGAALGLAVMSSVAGRTLGPSGIAAALTTGAGVLAIGVLLGIRMVRVRA
ncbi:MFS transporter [Amycolatopsis sp. NPDC051903]|uniref:MFS transporter n=1 Tax=Amycolatopsis sp. NPDC051903 TaxID=3363936 RepID=UPI0037B9FE2D